MATRPSNPNIRYGWPTFNRGRPVLPLHPSPAVRLAQTYRVAHGKNAMELYRRSCLRVAQGNTVLRTYGMLPLVIEQNAQIEASLASDVVPDLRTAIHECEQADCAEEMSDEALRYAEESGTLTVEQAKAAIRASAAKRYKAEIKEKALRVWIDQQEAEK
jgi:hypothetical protein